MSSKLTNDANDDAIRRLIEDGSDPTKPMFVDFRVAVPSEKKAQRMANAASKLGYKVHAYASPDCALPWTCECSTETLVTLEAIVAKETELGQLASPLGGFSHGWGSFGNKPGGQPA
jgi:regulator of RNase E activity RraB